MANVLGTLFVDLKANTAEFVAGMTRASVTARATGRDIEGTFSRLGGVLSSALAPLGAVGQEVASVIDRIGTQAGQTFASVGKMSVGLGALSAAGAGLGVAATAIGAGLFEAASHAAEFGARIFEAREKTGLTAATLSGIAALAKETGGNFDGLVTALARGTVNLEKTAESGGKTNSALFAMMGGAKGVAELGLKPMDDRIQTVLSRIFDLNNVGQRNVALSELLGKGWQENVSTLKLLAEQGYGPAIEAAKRFGAFFDDSAARQAKLFTVQMAEMRGEISALSLTVGQTAIPYFQGWMQGLQGMTSQLSALGDHAKVVAFALSGNFAGAAKAWRDASEPMRASVQAQTDFLVHTQALVAGAIKSTEEVAPKVDLTRAAKQPATDLERMAEASGKFWERFNAGLADAKTTFPPAMLSFTDSLAKFREEQDRVARDRSLKQSLEAMSIGAGGNLAGVPGPSMLAGPQPVMPLSTDELSRSMDRIMKAPPEVAARLDTLRAHFTDLFTSIEAQGKGFGDKVFGSMFTAIDGVSTELSRLVTTGKANFAELFQSLAASIMKAGIEDLFGRISAKAAAATGNASPAVTGATGGSGGSFFKTLAGVFGGFLAAGGDVTPGRAYIVGERHPEFFVPKVSGHVTPALATGGQHPMTNVFHFHGVQDFDSFKKSQGQVMAQFGHAISVAMSRNR